MLGRSPRECDFKLHVASTRLPEVFRRSSVYETMQVAARATAALRRAMVRHNWCQFKFPKNEPTPILDLVVGPARTKRYPAAATAAVPTRAEMPAAGLPSPDLTLPFIHAPQSDSS